MVAKTLQKSAAPVKKLEVWRTLSDASRHWVGTLAQNAQGVFFQYLASHANYANWPQAQAVIAEVIEGISHFADVARELGVAKETIVLISRQLDQVYQDNKGLVRG